MAAVSWLSVAPVKGLGLVRADEVTLARSGVVENRRFYLVDESGRLLSGLRHGPLVRIRAEYDSDRERLVLRFPDGTVRSEEVALGEAVATDWGARAVPGRVVEGPWAKLLSAYVGRPVRLVRAERPGDACSVHPVSLVADASVAELARRSGRATVDARRFRMLVGLAGCAAHEEDGWVGRRVALGEAVVRVVVQTARCATTTHDPETGVRDFDTLRAIAAYRGLRNGRCADMGVYADVERPGRVRLGDPVEPL